ncbi:MAG TPA: hypothetical protein VG389_24880 [Myxococcota bacterium]|jgi:hypothetical protein|nr:hypothetical protein [Myxococcota bacterium]
MMDYMRNGGLNMWLMLVSAVVVAGAGFTRAPDRRGGVLGAGAILLLIEAVFGMAMGMVAVASKYPLFAAAAADRAALVAQGLGELSNNGTFGALLALALGVGALVTRGRAGSVAKAAA